MIRPYPSLSSRWRPSARHWLFAMIAALLGDTTLAEGLRVGLIAKSVDDINFIEAGRSCAEEARKFGDECVLLGSREGGGARGQVMAIEAALKARKFDAFAISVTKSDFIAPAVQRIPVPVITFDSPFDARHAHLSRAYIGVDNLAFGRELGKVAKKLRPHGGTLCMMTSRHDTNLEERVQGVRRELSGNPHTSITQRLQGEGGWAELARCPWDVSDSVKRSLSEVDATLFFLKPDVFLSVGSWPIKNHQLYRETVAPYKEDIRTKKRIMIFGPGISLPAYKALMNEGLVHGYVTGDFSEIGRLSYRHMRDIAAGKAVPPATFVRPTIRISK